MGLGGARLVAVAHNFALGLVLCEKNLLQINGVVNLWTIFSNIIVYTSPSYVVFHYFP